MKKIIAVILALCLCIGITACSTEEEEKVMKTEIVGEWMAVSVNASVTFNDDGTGELHYNGKHSLTWKYDPDTDRYVVTTDQTYQALVSKEYDMPYVSLMDIDFYQFDDYDKAYTLMLSRRCEDIVNLTENMTKIELNKSYDLANAVTIQFTDIAGKITGTDNDGLLISYTVVNERIEPVSEGLSANLNSRYYLASQPTAITKTENVNLVSEVGAGEMAHGSFAFSVDGDVSKTVDAYGMVIGALYFEMYGQNYYIDLSMWLH